MKIAKIALDNFRGYSTPTSLNIHDLNILIGANDAGKSTWLEALDIFFENTKPDKDDVSVDSGKTFSITVSFIPPESMIIDSTNPIDLNEEFLLESNNLLTIRKSYTGTTAPKVFLIANHPTNTHLGDLLKKKIDELKNIALTDLKLSEDDISGSKSKANTWRQAIRTNISDAEEIVLSEREILISDDASKDIWNPIKKSFPSYALFRVDRKNFDGDEEVQDPFKTAIKLILASDDIRQSIEDLKKKVKSSYTEIANATIEELEKINSDLAKKITPDFGDPKLDTAFKPNIVTDDGVPLNKRGSGVRRMILLSFFKADALKNLRASNAINIIYAIEEPETSQHPDHQKLLIESLTSIAESEESQVIFTTHSPQLLKNCDYKYISHIQKSDDGPCIEQGSEALISAKECLGEFPKIDSGHIICLEGKNDINFMLGLKDIPEVKEILDIEKCVFLQMNGGFVEKWAQEHYFEKTDIKEFHIYDKDSDAKYQDTATAVNSWGDCSAVLTSKREIENYIHPTLINSLFNTSLTFTGNWDEFDIPKHCESESGNTEADCKSRICSLSNQMTKQLFDEIDAWEELESWLKHMKEINPSC